MGEASHRLAYAERQWAHFKLRAEQSHLRAALEIARGNHDKAEDFLDVARRHLDFVNECNDTIDELRRDCSGSTKRSDER